ncbi:iron export ABC transporter permease subunit FetB [Sulfurivirga sp.]|uniref:ABC transporter permease n=1 Tax=Sulfurivirga sp. TaxID=2614236 RepID=UPI0025CC8842|nr:iron export ABC transporter permease subunit FetB [Sulfurivirga sp.]
MHDGNMIVLQWTDLAFLSVWFLLAAGWLALEGFGQTRTLLINGVRMGLQLALMGVWLSWVFAQGTFFWVALVWGIMLLMAGYEVHKRQQHPLRRGGSLLIGLIALSMTALVLTVLTLVTVVEPRPWYAPQYAIPLLGMVLGNSMTAVALALDQLTRQARDRRAAVEAQLALGEPPHQAMTFVRRQALQVALTPMVNMLAAAGVVSLPGMMTGQILAGADPMEAVKYQIMIILLIVVSTALGAVLAVRLGQRRLFDARARLRLDWLS